jgi:hypothetical protein
LLEDVALFLINRAVRLAGNVEKECAILADRVHHPADHLRRLHVSAVFARTVKQFALIMPLPTFFDTVNANFTAASIAPLD